MSERIELERLGNDAIPSRRAPTVNDVAGRAGVSPKTVSRALNNEGNVRPDAVARVRRAAAELGFRPNQFARLLRTRGTASMVGVVTASVGDPFWTGVLQGVEAAIGGGDRFILSASTRDRSDRESEIVAAMVERRVMALLVVPTALDQSYLGAIAADGTPVVCLDRPAVGADIDAVVADDVGGVRRGMDLLTEHGHRRIAYLGTGSIYTAAKRVEGYRQALAASGIVYDEALVHAAIHDETLIDPAVDALLALADPPTAVFTANVNTSIGLLSGLRQRRWKPAIVAFSDFDAARIHDPAVTVVDNDPVELGRRGAELALERLDGYRGPVRRVCIDTPIIGRESHLVGPP
jgi:LacI family transcriptional regulator, galactose operon repressor